MQRKQRTTKLNKTITNLQRHYSRLILRLKHTRIGKLTYPFVIKHERIFSTLLIILLFIPTVLLIEPLIVRNEVEASWYDTNWSFRERIPLTNTSGTDQTNWQTQITFDTSTLISNGKMLSTCNDIRFTNNNGKLLPYWIEPNTCNTTTSKIWIKVDSIPTTGGNIYIYYGNPSASSANYKTSDVFIRDMTSSTATWPLDDTTSTQSYSRVTNPAVTTGRNIVINGTFDVDANWAKGSGWSISGGVAVASGATASLVQTIPMISGKVYTVTYTISGYSSGSIRPFLGNNNSGTLRSANGTFTDTIICDTGTANIAFAVSTFTGNIDNVIVTQPNIPSSGATPTQLLADGNMEAAGTASWVNAGGHATLSKDTTTPHSGTQSLKVLLSSGTLPYVAQDILLTGNVYRVFGYARSDGSAIPEVGDEIVHGRWTGTTSTTWQPFDITFTGTTGSRLSLMAFTSTIGQYAEFDDVTVSIDNSIRPDQILSTLDGDMEQSGTSYWTVGNSAILTKVSTSPHGGTQDLKVAYNGLTTPYASQNILVIGKTYRVTGYVKSDGNSTKIANGGAQIASSFSTSWTFFDETFVATAIDIRLVAASSTGAFGEFDDFSVTEIDPLVGKLGRDASGNPDTTVPTLGATANGHLTNAYSFDGTNDNVNIYSSDLNSAFNPSEGTVVAWAKVSGAGVWSGTNFPRIVFLRADDNNRIVIGKAAQANAIAVNYIAGGTNSAVTQTSISTTNWFQVVITWSKSSDQVKAYFNGVQVGATQTGLGTWVGNFTSAAGNVDIGWDNSADSTRAWSGLINDVHLYSRALSSSEISDLYGNGTVDRQVYYTENYPGHELITQTSTTLSVGAPAAEEVGSGPILWYKLDDATGTSAKDSSSNANNGTLGGTTIPTWQIEDLCASGKCLFFDGTSSKVTGSKVASGVKSIGFWINPTTAVSKGIMNLDGGTHTIQTNSLGVLTATGFTSPTYYVNGYQTTTPTLVGGQWNYVEITTNTSFNTTSSFTIGTDGTNFTGGYIDEVKFFNYVRTAAQAQVDFNGVANKIATSKPLPSGLVASWGLQDATSTQSYSAVTNPAVATGRNFVLNGTFDDTSQWTVSGNTSITGGQLVFSASNISATHSTGSTTPGKFYQTTYTISGYSAGSVAIRVNNTSGTLRSSNGTFTEILQAGSTASSIVFNPNTFTGNIDNVIVTQVNIPSSGATPTQLLTDGDMETSGTAAWTAGNSATLSKQAGTPHAGSQVLRIARNGSSTPYAKQTVITAGNVYRVYGFMRSDGSATPIVRENGLSTGKLNIVGSTSTTWQPFDAIFIAGGTDIDFGTTTNTGTQFVEFDDITVALDTSIRPDQILSTLDGNMEQSGTSYWSALNSTTLSKQTTNPHGGTQVLRTTRNGSTTGARQTVFVIGKTYRVTGFVRGDGSAVPNVGDAATTYFTGTSSTTWQAVDVTAIATNGQFAFNCTTAVDGQFCEFDDFTMQEVDPLVGKPTNGVSFPTASGGHLTNAYSFDGTNDVVNIYSTDLNSAFNPSEGTMVAWAKVSGSGVWSDGTARFIVQLSDNGTGNNQVVLVKPSGSNQLIMRMIAGGVNTGVTMSSVTTTGWFQVAVTWSKSSDQVKAYFNGAQTGSTITGLGTWSANLGSTTSIIGATSTAGTSSWSGLINDVRLYNRALNTNEITQLYNISSGPVGYWKFDEKTGTTANDSSGNGHTGTLQNGATWKVGKYGSAVSLDGTTKYVSSTYAYTSFDAVTYTVEGWAKRTDNATRYTLIGSDNASHPVMLTTELGSNDIKFWRDGGSSPVTFSNAAPAAGQWFHWALVDDPIGNTTKLYINGALFSSTANSNTYNATPGNFEIGARGTTTNAFNGQIDEVKIYNYARTPQQILEDMQGALNATEISGSATTTKPNTAIGEWKFDEGYGTTANNSGSAGSTLNGTLTNMASPATSTSGWQVASSNCKYIKCLAFDGTNDYIRMGNQSSLNFSNSFSVSAWVKTTQSLSAGTYGVIAGKGFLQSGSGVDGYGLYLSGDDSSNVHFQVRNGTTFIDVSGGNIRDGKWHHIVGVRDHSANTSYIYVDGTLKAKDSTTSFTDYSSTREFGVGARHCSSCGGDDVNGYNFYFSGSIDDPKVYGGALTPDEIKEEYNATTAINYGIGTTEGSNFTNGAGNAAVADWEFDEKTGSTVNDVSGNANTGTWNGTLGNQWTVGKYGAAGNFNGTDNYVNIPGASALNFGNVSFTFSTWFKTSTALTSELDIISNYDNTRPSIIIDILNTHIDIFTRDSNLSVKEITGTTAVNDGKWHYVTGVRDQTNSLLKLYLDGNLVGSIADARTGNYIATSTNANAYYISSSFNGTSHFQFFPGQIDGVKIYNYARTQDQIAYDYNRGLPVGWWKLDECQGTIAHDSSGNNNSGTITIGGTGTQTLAGNCNTASTAWGNGAVGKYNASLNFDGTDDYVGMADTNFPTGANQRTISVWAKPTDYATTARPIFTYGTEGSGQRFEIGIRSGQIVVSANGGAYGTTNIPAANQWVHIVAVVPAGATTISQVQLYMNGIQRTTSLQAGSNVSLNTVLNGSSQIGTCIGRTNTNCFSQAYSGLFTGQIDDVRVYNYALTATQVKLLYNGGFETLYAPVTGSP